MTPERWQRIKVLLDELLEIDPEQREALLRRRCAGDSQLRMAVESMLRACDEAGSFLEPDASPPPRLATTEGLADPRLAVGQTLGREVIRELLGEGGYSRVYLAEQTSPVRRKVALKIVKASGASRIGGPVQGHEVKARPTSKSQDVSMLSEARPQVDGCFFL